MLRILSTFVSCLILSISLGAQEICDNGIDDDNDGLIDLFDDECACNDFVPSSLIPNPSFELMSCCPNNEAQLNCAESWIQASQPTTDYYHTCDYVEFDFINAAPPQPFPDGDGCIGFRDGKPGNRNFKEYAGACLIEPMTIGTEYTLDFFTGFPDRNQSTSFEITLYSSINCGFLPFGIGDEAFGCPTNGPGWIQLDQMTISGNDEWINTVFKFVADQPYAAIALGPGCDTNDTHINPYFFFDRLALAESEEFGVPFAAITGEICNNTLTLQFEENPDYEFQWYKDGIAILGATTSDYTIPGNIEDEGVYVVVINSSVGCFSSVEYVMEIPSYSTYLSANICDGEVFNFLSTEFTTGGLFDFPLIASDGCDSTVTLELFEIEHTTGTFIDSICIGENYTFLGQTLPGAGIYEVLTNNVNGCDSIITVELGNYDNSTSSLTDSLCIGDTYSFLGEVFIDGGSYDVITTNAQGCDSIITLELQLIDANDGLEIGPDIAIELGDIINLNPIQFDPDNVTFIWSTQSGMQIGDELNLVDIQPLNDQLYILSVVDENGCAATDSVRVRVAKDIEIYAPNVFSPNGDGNNETFFAIGNKSIIGLEEVYIFDRWGNLVFTEREKAITPEEPLFNWNGKFNRKDATEGVYVFIIKALALDGSFKDLSGSVTLLR